MVQFYLVGFAAILAATGLLFQIVETRKRPEIPEEARFIPYNCMIFQICDCGLYERFQTCYEILTEETQAWIIDEFNACELGTFNYDFAAAMDLICKIPDEDRKPCYSVLYEKYSERLNQSASQLGSDETPAFAKAGNCAEPIYGYCEAYPGSCMSLG
ncbi:uncharacterized protein LOC129972624 [Argiope bruennichi]|uniref:uncharacterized protein LOC129972624 n=1 Tax=Argiope bruennichi TaxID=94029 RepID=UPI0024954FD1|nr:uncharacterized protein LOC129972624 [Argiope bruennichi]